MLKNVGECSNFCTKRFFCCSKIDSKKSKDFFLHAREYFHQNGEEKKKRLGKDAKVMVLSKYLHPSRLIQSALQNIQANHRLGN